MLLTTLFFFGVAFQANDPRSILIDGMRVRQYGISFTTTSIRTGNEPPFFPNVTIGTGKLTKGMPRDDDGGVWAPQKEDMERWCISPSAAGTIDFVVHYPPFVYASLDPWGTPTWYTVRAMDIPIHIENFRSSDVDKNGFSNGDDYDLFSQWFVDGDWRADWDDNGFVNGDDFDLFCDFYARGS